ncbi:MAG TPA: hypothetical protein VGB85_06090, partial [Nannocystis sp.]
MFNFFTTTSSRSQLLATSRSRLLATSILAASVLAACGDNTAMESSSDTSTTGTPPETTTPVTTDPVTTTGELVLLCEPGAERCADSVTREICKPTGLQWEPVSCGNYQTCNEEVGEEGTIAKCEGPCEVAETNPTSVGCEFLAIR